MEDIHSINPRTEDEYLKSRVVDQINWYDKKSVINKSWFLSLKISEILVALFIPFLSAYISNYDNHLNIVVGILGIIVAAIAGTITLVKFQEKWIEYRTVAESLKLEKFLFLAKAGPYKDSEEPFQFFVERFESLISTSTKKWVNFISAKEAENRKK
jgi:hypothetical protein